MRQYLKKFKITELMYRASDRSHRIILCSSDCEVWEVTVDRLADWESLWRVGLVIEMPMILSQQAENDGKEDRVMVPDFSSHFGDPAARRKFYPDAFSAVNRWWGADEASKHFPSEARVEPMDPAPLPPPPTRRRKSKLKEPPPSGAAGQDETTKDR